MWRARIGLFAARLVSRLPKRWRKAKKQHAGAPQVNGGGLFVSGSNFRHKTRFLLIVMSLLLATAVVHVSLLLRSGDIETNPGPGRYPGELGGGGGGRRFCHSSFIQYLLLCWCEKTLQYKGE